MRLALLILIPMLTIAGEFTTSLGDAYPYMVSAITTDSAGNTYVVGSRAFGGGVFYAIFNPLPVTGGISFGPTGTLSSFEYGGSDVFVSKLDPNGKLLFTDTFAGKGNDMGLAIALDPAGNIYIAGTTTSPDFPLSKALQIQSSAYGTGFIIKLSNDGTTILYSTYFGGTLGATSITALATDSKGNLYLTGYTQASDFPHTAVMPFGQISQSPASPGVIIASISATGDRILYSGAIVVGTPCTLNNSNCISNGLFWEGIGIGVDAAGNAYIGGNVQSFNLPTTAGSLSPGGIGAFVGKVNAGGAGLGYLTHIGSGFIGSSHVASALNTLRAITVDAAGNAYLAGVTTDPSFPSTPGAYQPVPAEPSGSPNGFLAKLKPDGSAMVWATYFGAADPQSIAIDPGGSVWITGTTPSTFPNTNGWATGPEFVAGLNAAGSKLIYSALYPSGTVAQSVAVDPSGLVHVAGVNGFVSAIAPTTAPTMKIFALQNAFGSNVTARISPAEVISIYGRSIGATTAVTATPTGGFYPKTLAVVQVTINGMNMPLLYVSANQINAVVPMEIAAGSTATVRVINGTTVSPDYPVWMVGSTPQAFPTVLNQDGTINSQTNPSKGGSIITFYATGWQSSFTPLADGQVATAAENTYTCSGSPGVCLVGGTVNSPQVAVLYAGAAPGIVAGVTQFNVQIGAIPSSSAAYQFNFSLIAGISQSVWVTP